MYNDKWFSNYSEFHKHVCYVLLVLCVGKEANDKSWVITKIMQVAWDKWYTVFLVSYEWVSILKAFSSQLSHIAASSLWSRAYIILEK
jgi:putative Ca2+/H+ antiporter (TMEM165/GDT1 family)